MKDAENTTQSSSDHNCRSFTNGSENSKERTKARYKKYQYSKVHFDYKKIGNSEQNLWHRKPCIFCGLYNHVVGKCWKRMEARKKTRHVNLSPHQGRKKVKQF